MFQALRWVVNPNGTRDLQYFDGYVWTYIDRVSLSQVLEEERITTPEKKGGGDE